MTTSTPAMQTAVEINNIHRNALWSNTENPDQVIATIIQRLLNEDREELEAASSLILRLQEDNLAKITVENERLRTEHAGKDGAFAEDLFLLGQECGIGASSRPPGDFVREKIAQLTTDRDALAKELALQRLSLNLMRNRGSFIMSLRDINDRISSIDKALAQYAAKGSM